MLLEKVVAELQNRQVPIELGPLERMGAIGKIFSVYVGDTDQNLVEISNYI